MEAIEKLKIILREEAVPFFSDKELLFYLEENKTVEETAYCCLLIKAEDTALNVSGLSTGDSSKYFRRLASNYRPNHSGLLKSAY